MEINLHNGKQITQDIYGRLVGLQVESVQLNPVDIHQLARADSEAVKLFLQNLKACLVKDPIDG